eukprot:scaffold24040_cov67-Phaeocystis_antarctica.AAC.7
MSNQGVITDAFSMFFKNVGLTNLLGAARCPFLRYDLGRVEDVQPRTCHERAINVIMRDLVMS